jgi:hypothetical protein
VLAKQTDFGSLLGRRWRHRYFVIARGRRELFYWASCEEYLERRQPKQLVLDARAGVVIGKHGDAHAQRTLSLLVHAQRAEGTPPSRSRKTVLLRARDAVEAELWMGQIANEIIGGGRR